MRVALKRDSGIDDRAAEGAAPRRAGPGVARRAVLLRAGRHRQRGDELRLADAGRGGRERAEFRRDPALCGQDPRRARRRSPRCATCRWSSRSTIRRSRSTWTAKKAGLVVRFAGRRVAVDRPGHFLQPLHRAELLGRSQDGHRIPGPGRGAAAGGPLAAGDQAARLDRGLEWCR